MTTRKLHASIKGLEVALPPPTSSARLFMKSHLALMFWLRSRSMHNLWIVVVLLCSTCVDLPDLPRAQCQPRPVLSTSISDVDVHSPLTRQHVAVCLTLWVFRDVRSGMSHDAIMMPDAIRWNNPFLPRRGRRGRSPHAQPPDSSPQEKGRLGSCSTASRPSRRGARR